MSDAKKGSFKNFYSVVSFLIPNFNRFVVDRSLISLVYESIKFIPVYLVKLIVDNLFVNQDIKQAAILTSMIFGILTLLIVIEMTAYTYTMKKVLNFQKGLLERVHKKLMRLPLSFHEKQSTGSMVSKINKGANYLSDLLWFVNNEIIPTVFQSILTSIWLIATEWHIGLIYLISVPFILWYIAYNGKKCSRIGKHITDYLMLQAVSSPRRYTT
ncbi:MAG TPA: ABC transporter transmembrane domain-containing protein [Candidatus Nanoarchaeia archaeon]|nr:ABC transporter transmembrane domain-containing protein [Candidatus Nanoarchaeia archaeon]